MGRTGAWGSLFCRGGGWLKVWGSLERPSDQPGRSHALLRSPPVPTTDARNPWGLERFGAWKTLRSQTFDVSMAPAKP